MGHVLQQGSLARIGARGGARRPGIKVSSDKKLGGWQKIIEGSR